MDTDDSTDMNRRSLNFGSRLLKSMLLPEPVRQLLRNSNFVFTKKGLNEIEHIVAQKQKKEAEAAAEIARKEQAEKEAEEEAQRKLIEEKKMKKHQKYGHYGHHHHHHHHEKKQHEKKEVLPTIGGGGGGEVGKKLELALLRRPKPPRTRPKAKQMDPTTRFRMGAQRVWIEECHQEIIDVDAAKKESKEAKTSNDEPKKSTFSTEMGMDPGEEDGGGGGNDGGGNEESKRKEEKQEKVNLR